jgi:hypothetical protein
MNPQVCDLLHTHTMSIPEAPSWRDPAIDVSIGGSNLLLLEFHSLCMLSHVGREACDRQGGMKRSTLCLQRRLREVFSEHLKVAIEWHSLELERAADLLIKQDQANHWLASSGSLSRLDSARSLMLECRKQSENALTVLSQSAECVHLFAEALTSVLKVGPPLFFCAALQPSVSEHDCI